MQLHLVLIYIKAIYGIFCSVEHFDLRHSELCRKREVQHPGCKWGFDLLHQSVHRDQSSTLYRLFHVAELLLNVLEPLLPRPLPCLILIKDGPIASIVPTMPPLIAILSWGFVRVMLSSLASLSFSIYFLRRDDVLLFFLGNGVLAFSDLSHLLGALYLPSELLRFSQQVLVGETECLYLVGVGV